VGVVVSVNAQKEIREIIRKLKRHGVEVEQLPNGHWRTKTTPPVTMSYSPSDTNAARAAARDIRNHLGIDIRLSPAKRKDSANDFAMNRLRERALKQMERGASVADLARLTVACAEDKRIGGWPTTGAAEVGISGVMRGNRVVKQNHDALAAALGKLESASEKDFPKHLDKAAERFGKRRIAHKAEVVPLAREERPADPDPTAELRAENDARLEAAEVELREHEAGAALRRENADQIEVTLKIELGDRTLALFERLLAR
jgi:hypothetical protein